MCSRNRWRSPTGERIFARRAGLELRSRGLSRTARRTLTAGDLAWADLILVMEYAHHERLLEDHCDALGSTPVHVLDVPDEYGFMDPELVALLEIVATPIVDAALRLTQPGEIR